MVHTSIALLVFCITLPSYSVCEPRERKETRVKSMGNCQAVDAATLVIQHPSGKVDKFYWPVSASEVMRTSPGHYLALLISTTTLGSSKDNEDCPSKTDNTTNQVRLTRIKLLKPTDTLVLGQVYRLVTPQDVMKGLSAKKQAKLRKNQQSESIENPERENGKPDLGLQRVSHQEDHQVKKHERHRSRTATSANGGGGGSTNTTRSSRAWHPALQSISETAS